MSTCTWAMVSDVVVAHVRHARQDEALTSPTCVMSADATSAGRDDSGRQRPRVAPSADRGVSVVQRHSAVTSTFATSERCNVSGPQRQIGAMSASRNVRARNVSVALRQSAETSA